MKRIALVAIQFLVVMPAVASALQLDPSTQINFAIDCMIHDAKGNMLADLGSIGLLMDGSYQATGQYAYRDLTVSVDLKGPFSATPEVSLPQLKLSFAKSRNPSTVTAMVITSAIPGINAALWEPSEHLFLHCDQMKMQMSNQ